MNHLLTSIRTLLVLTVVTGLLYPLGLTALARVFPSQADGSQITRGDVVVGSKWLAQKNPSPRYFQPRPSAGDYATVASGASNLGPTSAVLANAVAARKAAWGDDAPTELLTTSGSGLDPHVSPEAAAFQIPRVAKARGLSEETVAALVGRHTEGSQWGFLGEPRVNILLLNLALDDTGRP